MRIIRIERKVADLKKVLLFPRSVRSASERYGYYAEHCNQGQFGVFEVRDGTQMTQVEQIDSDYLLLEKY
ncbi:MAG: hypothetical protein WD361_01025 [Gracilimonas sp.]